MASPRALLLALGVLSLGLAACSSAQSTGVSAPNVGTGTGQASPFLNANLTDVACASTLQCAAVGINFDSTAKAAPMASSADGGLTWTLDRSEAPVGTKLSSVACGPGGCLSVGRSIAGALVYRLAPGGISWVTTARPSNDALAEVVACAARHWCAGVFHDATHRWFATTLDGGHSWSDAGTLPDTTAAIYQLSCADSLHCIAGGVDTQGNGLISSTSDGGSTWTAANLGQSAATRVWDVACRTHTSCTALVDLAGATATAVVTSEDGGATFTALSPAWSAVPTPRALSCTATSCVIVGADTAGHGAAAVLGSSGSATNLSLNFAPTPLLGVSCATAGRCVAAGLGSLVTLSPSVPKGSQQQSGQFRN